MVSWDVNEIESVITDLKKYKSELEEYENYITDIYGKINQFWEGNSSSIVVHRVMDAEKGYKNIITELEDKIKTLEYIKEECYMDLENRISSKIQNVSDIEGGVYYVSI